MNYGLDQEYTQILINGEQVPGSGVDRSLFVDRIPTELIERVEIVRSSSADRSGDALSGTINIILRDALPFDGGDVKGSFRANYGSETMGGAGFFWVVTSRTSTTRNGKSACSMMACLPLTNAKTGRTSETAPTTC